MFTQAENLNASAFVKEARDAISLSGVIQCCGIDNRQTLVAEMHGGVVHRTNVWLSPESPDAFHNFQCTQSR